MKQSHLFTKTRKETPADEQAKNAQLLIRAGFIHKEMAGAYDLLPLGLRVVEKIKQIVREEMDAIGGQEMIMTSIQPKDTWIATDRWDDEKVDVWFKSQLHAGGEIGFGWSHEEPITNMMKNHLASFRDLPAYVYQFQVKMRNELRAKSGLLRGREFIMKDMYSYTMDATAHEAFYQSVMDAYTRVYDRLGLGESTFITYAEGGAFTDNYSHEFQTICAAGEDIVYINREKNIALNEEVINDTLLAKMDVTMSELERHVTAEVGNIFTFGTEKCEKMDLKVTDENGEQSYVHLGSYGIGITRVMAVIAENMSDDNGLIWPESIAPFRVHLISMNMNEKAQDLYQQLQDAGVEVLYDDRDVRAGEKFADADLIGIPWRVVISERSLENGGVEVKRRGSDESKIIALPALFEKITSILQN
ncbi:prolyl-tRNA synthetase [Candidatus Nomurabacteria bacterium]|nr:prolyl-tRNA synthetase [Candidatus Nomurabacteria bacterium]